MLNFLIWVILIYFALLLIWRYVVPFLLRRAARKLERKFNAYAGQQHYNKSKEGEVRIDHIPEKEPYAASPKNDDDYTDFEEIIDNDKHP